MCVKAKFFSHLERVVIVIAMECIIKSYDRIGSYVVLCWGEKRGDKSYLFCNL